jgi:DNA-binding transcriptional LysR family regulator
VQAGVGVSLVPRSARLMRVPDVRLLDTNLAEAKWRIGIAWRKVDQSDPLVRNFVGLARRARNVAPAPKRESE